MSLPDPPPVPAIYTEAEEFLWVFGCALSREDACELLQGPPWFGRSGCFLVRHKGAVGNNSFALSVVGTTGQILHHFLRCIDDQWIVQHSVDRPCAPSSVSLLEVIEILRDPNGAYALNLKELIVPPGVKNPVLSL